MAVSCISSPCPQCILSAPEKWKGVENLGDISKTDEQERLIQCLHKQKLLVNLGAGRQESFQFNDANEMYLKRHYPALSTEVYCCPPVFKYKDQDEPSDTIFAANDESLSPMEKRYDTLKRKRVGDLAEEKVIVKLVAMLKKHKTASFILHGYNWKTKYLNYIQKLLPKSLSKSILKSLGEGEVDILLSVPDQCMIDVEVKAVDDAASATGVVKKALYIQCQKTCKFMSTMNFDLVFGKNIPLIKVVALPNLDKASVEEIYCKQCSTHIITKQDLENIDTLHEWFGRIKTQYLPYFERSQFDIKIHEGVIGRLVGPASMVEVISIPQSIKQTVSEITDEYGAAESVRKRWYQFNPQQLSVKFSDPKMLWLTGEPGSGKTVLGLWIVSEILKSQNESVLYVLAGFDALCLLQTFKNKLYTAERGENCEMIITTVREISDTEEYYLKIGKFLECQDLPRFMKFLQEKHPGKTVHVIMDEAPWFLRRVDHKKFTDDWNQVVDQEKAGYLWIIQDSSCVELDDPLNLSLFKFFHLSHIMRMSKQNVEFANVLLNKEFKSGHAVSGKIPTVYNMDCICLEPQQSTCFSCHGVRVAWLLRQALLDFRITKAGLPEEVLRFENVAFLSRNFKGIASLLNRFEPDISFILQKYPENESDNMTVCSVGDFRGCEQSIVFTDLDTAGCATGQTKECLTRTLGQLVILNGGCNPVAAKAYDEQITKVEIESYMGNIEYEVVEPSEEEMRHLRKMLIFHLNNEIQQLEEQITNTLKLNFQPQTTERNVERLKKSTQDMTRQKAKLESWLSG